MLGLVCFLAHKTVMMVIMSFIGAFFVVYGAAFFVGYSYLSNLLDADSLEAFTMAFDTLGEHPLLLLAVGCLSSFGCAVQRSTESPIREV